VSLRDLGMFAVAMLSACSQGAAGSGSGSAEGAAVPPAAASSAAGRATAIQHYLLRSGELVPQTSNELAQFAARSEFAPWTVQSRVVHVASIGGRTFLGINGHGLARMDVAPETPATFTYFYDSALFGGRTLTNLFDWGGHPTANVYVDHVLAGAAVSAEESTGPSPPVDANLVRLREGALAPLASPHKALDPRWQSVAVVQVAPHEALVEWKLGDRGGTQFRYTRLSLGASGAVEVAVDRRAFLAGYGFRGVSDPAVPAELRTLARDIIDQFRSTAPGAFHFLLRHPLGTTERLRFQPDSAESLLTVPIVETATSYIALLPGGLLREHNRTGEDSPRQYLLPPLPDGLSYVDLYLGESLLGDGSARLSTLLVLWEQALFYRVGAAGLSIVDLH
jgi:hypothetical protein